MAPIKFEKDIKEKLEQRKLQPNTNVWDNLEKRLEAEDHEKSNSRFWWIGIAASFVGILIITNMLFNRGGVVEVASVIVDIEAVEDTESNKGLPVFTKDVEKVVVETAEPEIKTLVKRNSIKKENELKFQIQQKSIIQDAVKDAVAQTELEPKKEDKDLVGINKEKLSFEDLKIQEVVAQVEALKSINHTVSDKEINALLDQAQHEISLHKLYNETTKKVDANALLEEVESDLEQSFRDKAFKAIQSGYKYVKTAVADRNN